MDSDTIIRPHYYERQFLRTQDFVVEQAYQLTMNRRHVISQHIWGIVRGLEISIDPDGNLSVLPGMAVDGYGRTLLLAQQQSIPHGAFDVKGDTLEVWAVYNQTPATDGPSGAVCRTDTPEAFYRLEEQAIIEALPPNLTYPNRRQPPGVPAGDVNFDPSRTPPDDPLDRWPVYLGMAQRGRPGPNKPYVYSVDLSDRPYAGLVGEAIRAPSGRARVQIGSEKRDDRRRFAVFLQDAAAARAGQPVEELEPRLEIDQDGSLTMRSQTTVYGDLTVDGGSLIFGVGSAQVKGAPWRMYHTIVEPPKNTNTPPREQLRIEMAGPGSRGKGWSNEVAIGHWSAQANKFVPCLIVADDCTVTVNGTLVVNGKISQQSSYPPIDADDQALLLIQQQVNAILTQGGTDTQANLQNALTITTQNDDQAAAFAAMAAATPGARRRLLLALLNTLEGDEKTLAEDLVAKLRGEG
jgi:hypothetical protein